MKSRNVYLVYIFDTNIRCVRLLNNLKMGGGWMEIEKLNKELQTVWWLINEDTEAW